LRSKLALTVAVPAVAAVAFAVAALSPSRADAFADATQFFPNPVIPYEPLVGAASNGIYFTGAPRFAARTCADCHANGPGLVGLKLGSDDQSLFTSGYVPGKTYRLQVELTNETEGLKYTGATCTDPPGPDDVFAYQQCNYNGYGLEIDAPGDIALNSGFCASPPNADGSCPMPTGLEESLVAPGNDAVFDNLPHSLDPDTPYLELRNDPKIWDLWWTAPRAGTGPLTIYVGAVDGNGGAGIPQLDQDPDGDDVVAATFYIQESGGAPIPGATAGCAVSFGRRTGDGWIGGWMVLLLLSLRRRDRIATGASEPAGSAGRISGAPDRVLRRRSGHCR
jgi:hypothetical protein